MLLRMLPSPPQPQSPTFHQQVNSTLTCFFTVLPLRYLFLDHIGKFGLFLNHIIRITLVYFFFAACFFNTIICLGDASMWLHVNPRLSKFITVWFIIVWNLTDGPAILLLKGIWVFPGWGILLTTLQRTFLCMNPVYTCAWFFSRRLYLEMEALHKGLCFFAKMFQHFAILCFPISSFWEFIFASTWYFQPFKHCNWRVRWGGVFAFACVW